MTQGLWLHSGTCARWVSALLGESRLGFAVADVGLLGARAMPVPVGVRSVNEARPPTLGVSDERTMRGAGQGTDPLPGTRMRQH